MTNNAIKNFMEQTYEKLLKIKKRHKEGLKSGMRIVTMKKDKFDENPLPSYICIEGCELYVTYTEQTHKRATTVEM